MGIDLGRFRSDKSKNEWVDWLADDPVPASIRSKMRRKAVEQASKPVVRHPGVIPTASSSASNEQSKEKSAAVSIQISIPKFSLKKPKVKLPTIPPQLIKHKNWAIGGVAAFAIVLGAAGILIATKAGSKDEGKPQVLAEVKQQADFRYSLPKGNTEGIEGDVRYNAQRKLVNFRDSIGGVQITVSQQPLPEGFKDNTKDKVKKLAADFSATKTIATANPTAYIGTSEKGPQTVIFSKKDLLVFIQSTKIIDDHDWAEYITNLQ